MFSPFFAGFTAEGAAASSGGSSPAGAQQVSAGFSSAGGGQTPASMRLPLAPDGPADVEVVAGSARDTGAGGAASALPILPPTMGALSSSMAVPAGFAEVLDFLGVEASALLEDFVCMPHGELEAALYDARFVNELGEERALTGMQRAGVVRTIRLIFAAMGMDVPLLGGSLPAGSQAQSVQQPPLPSASGAAPGSVQMAADAPSIAPDTVALHAVVDQNLKGHVKLLSFSELAAYRNAYDAAAGCPPSDEHTPSSEQLSALRALLAAGRVPFVDFAVWGPLGPRMAKFRRTEACVLVGSEFVSKHIEGPGSFEAWEQSWGLFSVAMITLNAASPGALSSYLSGIKALLRMAFKWPLVFSTDLVVRSERWGKIREECERCRPPGFSPERPWDYVIASSSFGRDGPGAMWWHTQLTLPVSMNASLPILAGVPSPASSSSLTSEPIAKRARVADSSSTSSEICSLFNSRDGRCFNSGRCAFGRLHRCSVCGGDHRAIDVHPGFKGKGKGEKGKNKKGKGDKGKNRKGGKGAKAVQPEDL